MIIYYFNLFIYLLIIDLFNFTVYTDIFQNIIQLGRELCIKRRKPTMKQIYPKRYSLDGSKQTNSTETEEICGRVKPAGLKSVSCPWPWNLSFGGDDVIGTSGCPRALRHFLSRLSGCLPPYQDTVFGFLMVLYQKATELTGNYLYRYHQ